VIGTFGEGRTTTRGEMTKLFDKVLIANRG
jgi:hypothetical protein